MSRPDSVRCVAVRCSSAPATIAKRYEGFATGSMNLTHARPSSSTPRSAATPFARITGNTSESPTSVTSKVLRTEGRSGNHVSRRKPCGSRLVLSRPAYDTNPLSPGAPTAALTRVRMVWSPSESCTSSVRSANVARSPAGEPSISIEWVTRPRPSSTRGTAAPPDDRTVSAHSTSTRSCCNSTRRQVSSTCHGSITSATVGLSVRPDSRRASRRCGRSPRPCCSAWGRYAARHPCSRDRGTR